MGCHNSYETQLPSYALYRKFIRSGVEVKAIISSNDECGKHYSIFSPSFGLTYHVYMSHFVIYSLSRKKFLSKWASFWSNLCLVTSWPIIEYRWRSNITHVFTNNLRNQSYGSPNSGGTQSDGKTGDNRDFSIVRERRHVTTWSRLGYGARDCTLSSELERSERNENMWIHV